MDFKDADQELLVNQRVAERHLRGDYERKIQSLETLLSNTISSQANAV